MSINNLGSSELDCPIRSGTRANTEEKSGSSGIFVGKAKQPSSYGGNDGGAQLVVLPRKISHDEPDVPCS